MAQCFMHLNSPGGFVSLCWAKYLITLTELALYEKGGKIHTKIPIKYKSDIYSIDVLSLHMEYIYKIGLYLVVERA